MPDAIIEGIRERVATSIKAHYSVGIQVPEGRHNDLLESIISIMQTNPNDHWTMVTCNNTYHTLMARYPDLSKNQQFHVIDCISTYAGLTEPDNSQCTFIDSPTMLEHVILSILNSFTDLTHDQEKFVLIDSLSSLMLHNDQEMVRKFVTLLKNRARNDDMHIASILIEEERATNGLLQLNDKIVVLRDSFIG